jgi:hypothetical protein
MFKKTFVRVIVVFTVVTASAAMPQTPKLDFSRAAKTSSTTPVGCLQEVRGYAAKRQQEMMAATTPATPPANVNATVALSQLRAPLIAQITQAKTAMAKECASRLDAKKLGDKDLLSLVDLYTEAGQPELTRGLVERALSSKTLTAADRPALLVSAAS